MRVADGTSGIEGPGDPIPSAAVEGGVRIFQEGEDEMQERLFGEAGEGQTKDSGEAGRARNGVGNAKCVGSLEPAGSEIRRIKGSGTRLEEGLRGEDNSCGR